MPRLPDDTVLGGLPSGNSGRPIATFNTTAPGLAMESVGKGIRDLGVGIASGVKSFAEKDDDLNDTRAKSGFLTDKITLDEEFKNETDPEKLKQYPARLQGLVDKHAGSFGNARAAEKWKLERMPDVARYGVNAREKIFDHEKQRDIVDGNETLEKMKNIGANPDESDDNRKNALDIGDEIFRKWERKGYLTPVEAQARRKQWARDYTYKALEMMSPEDVAAAITPDAKPSEKAKYAYSFFVRQGWTPAQAAGIVGNLMHESNLHTKAEAKGDQKDGSSSIGIAQWDPTRLGRLKEFAAANRMDWHNIDAQLMFVQWELENTHSGAAAALRQAGTVRDAASTFADKFERPQGAGAGGYDALHGWGRRYKYAAAVAQQFGGLDVGTDRGRVLASFLDEGQRRTLMKAKEQEFAATRKAAAADAQVEASSVKSLIGTDINSIAETGQSIPDLTRERVASSFGPEAGIAFETDRRMAQRYYDTVNGPRGLSTMSPDQMAEALDQLNPAKNGEAGTPDYDRSRAWFDRAAKAASKVLEERKADPAAVADRQPEGRTIPIQPDWNNPATVAPLVSRRIETMTRLGIPPTDQKFFTNDEMTALMAGFDAAADPKQQQAAVRQLVETLRKVFGDDDEKIAKTVSDGLNLYQLDREEREALARIITKIGKRERVTPEDKAQADAAAKATSEQRATTNILSSIVSGATAGVPAGYPGIPAVEALGRTIGESRPARANDMQEDAISELWDNADNPKAVAAFMARYGQDTVERVLKARPSTWDKGRNGRVRKSQERQAQPAPFAGITKSFENTERAQSGKPVYDTGGSF